MLLARSEIYTRMLAMIFAVLDQSKVIQIQHLEAALAWMDYWVESVQYIFKNQKLINEFDQSKILAEEVYDQILKSKNGLTRTDLFALFNKHINKKQLNNALELLLTAVPIRLVVTQVRTNGPNKTIYTCAN